MSRHLYKQYVRLAAKWPKDQFKAPDRQLNVFMTQEIEKQFVIDSTLLPTESGLCERRYLALEQLYSNEAASLYPHNYKSGVFGLTLNQLQESSREENRRHFGLTPRVNIITKAWRSVFPSKGSNAANQ